MDAPSSQGTEKLRQQVMKQDKESMEIKGENMN
jgi:hypothetical protein